MARVLVVDDEPSVRSLLKEVLVQDTHEVYEAQDGNEAYQIYKQNPVELVITDLVMPSKSGIELIMRLMDETPDIRILAISGGGGITGHFDYLPIAKLIDAQAILKKPFSLVDLRNKVNEILAA